MQTEEKISINLNISDRYYPFKILAEKEELIRKAGKTINDAIAQVKKAYTDKDAQDLLAIASLQIIIKYIENESNTDISPYIKTLKEINEELDDLIKKEKIEQNN